MQGPWLSVRGLGCSSVCFGSHMLPGPEKKVDFESEMSGEWDAGLAFSVLESAWSLLV